MIYIFYLTPPPGSHRGNVYVRLTIVSPNIVSIVTQVLNPPEPSSAKFRWRGHTLEASDVISAIFLRIFSPTFSPLPTFGLAKVCLTMERCKREQSYTL